MKCNGMIDILLFGLSNCRADLRVVIPLGTTLRQRDELHASPGRRHRDGVRVRRHRG